MKILLEPAGMDRIDLCIEILNEGRLFQREQGFIQWPDDYPNRDIVISDIKEGKGYLVMMDRDPIGYLNIDFDGESAYEVIDGKWGAASPYAVLRRMAFLRKYAGRGLALEVLALVENICVSKEVRYIKTDTDFQNERMQHVLEKSGYKRRGVVILRGSGKIAYDKQL